MSDAMALDIAESVVSVASAVRTGNPLADALISGVGGLIHSSLEAARLAGEQEAEIVAKLQAVLVAALGHADARMAELDAARQEADRSIAEAAEGVPV